MGEIMSDKMPLLKKAENRAIKFFRYEEVIDALRELNKSVESEIKYANKKREEQVEYYNGISFGLNIALIKLKVFIGVLPEKVKRLSYETR